VRDLTGTGILQEDTMFRKFLAISMLVLCAAAMAGNPDRVTAGFD